MIADFVIEKMSAYIAGGMSAQSASHFTRGELIAIYKGNHYSRDGSGAMRPTPPPEMLTLEAAGQKCNAALNEILKICTQDAQEGATMNAETKQEETRGKAPEKPPRAAIRTGLEGLKNYVKRERA